jgi:hypothetical protein
VHTSFSPCYPSSDDNKRCLRTKLLAQVGPSSSLSSSQFVQMSGADSSISLLSASLASKQTLNLQTLVDLSYLPLTAHWSAELLPVPLPLFHSSRVKF